MIFDRDEWLDWRRAGIGASDVAGVLGLSPWESPYSIWAKKVGQLLEDDPSEAMEMGQDLEPVISKRFYRETGLHVAGEQTRRTHPGEEWARATLDGFVFEAGTDDVDLALGGFEAKSTSDSIKKWAEAVPVMYAAQVQWQMFVTGLAHTWLGVFHANFGLKFKVYEVERDEDDIALIVESARRFWVEHVLTGEPPETDAHFATTDTLKQLRATPGVEVELPVEIHDRIIDLRQLKTHVKHLENAIVDHENAIRAVLGEATDGVFRGRTLVTWRPQESTRIDTAALKAAEPELADKFSKTTEARFLRLASVKEG